MDIIQKKNALFPSYLSLLSGILFLFLLLTNPVTSSELVMSGLITWCTKMIPSLFPFMVLSGILLRTDLSYRLSRIFYPVLGSLFRLSPNCIYIILMGFLCGFPMGASIISESLSMEKISKREADLLLSFCNNIGPIYFISFVSVLCPYKTLRLTFAIMYLVPFFHGLVLRYTIYRDISFCFKKHRQLLKQKTSVSYGKALQASMQKAISSILYLGGYMVIFTVLQLPFYNSFYQLQAPWLQLFKGMFEISSGISALAPYPEWYGIVYAFFLPFCGFCCLYQTYAMIWDSPLSLGTYLKNKAFQTLCTIIIYSMI